MINKLPNFLSITLVMVLTALLLGCSYVEERQLNSGRKLWSSKNINHYRYVVTFFAFNSDSNKPVQIEVKDKRRVSLKCMGCDLEIEGSFDDLSSIEALFERIQSLLEDETRSLSAEYNNEFGYPIRIESRSKDRRISDSSSRIEISKFEVFK